MCRKLALAATALIAAGLAPLAMAAEGQGQGAVQPPAPAAGSAPAPAAPPAAPKPPRKASAQERAMADRLDPLARAAFWARESQIDPADAVAGTHLAAALRDLGQYDAAAATARQVLVVSPNDVEALMELARVRVAQGQGFYAIEPAQHAERLAPKDWRPLSLLGVAYVQVHRDDDAQAIWKAALALSPDNPAVLSNMAMALASQGDAASAEALLRRAVAQPGATLRMRQDLTLVLGIQGKLTEAEKLMRENLPPDQAEANMAYLRAVSTGKDAKPPAAPDTRTWSSVKGAGS